MKLVSLNAWGGRQFDIFTAFIAEHASTTDVFCLQEINHTTVEKKDHPKSEYKDHLFDDLRTMLPDFDGYYTAVQEGFNFRPTAATTSFGNALFVRKSLNVLEHGEVFVHRKRNALDVEAGTKGDWFTLGRMLQFAQIENGPAIFNFHGLWHLSGKGDIPERIVQSTRIANFINKFDPPKILCGDLNLNIDSASLELIEKEANLRNLVKEHNIKTTRSNLYDKKAIMPFADYTFVSPEIAVKKFEVPYSEASDHLPMILEWN
ncbi:MAG: endonuclease/exonuclease/phosphatase family protein [Candidatus Pacebacteria bacterium]|nr:endonuclease/exonuclease/phosphatase family protein [Candidatus Paceibacterota bacterium]